MLSPSALLIIYQSWHRTQKSLLWCFLAITHVFGQSLNSRGMREDFQKADTKKKKQEKKTAVEMKPLSRHWVRLVTSEPPPFQGEWRHPPAGCFFPVFNQRALDKNRHRKTGIIWGHCRFVSRKITQKNIKYFIVFAPLDVGDMVSSDEWLLGVFCTIRLLLHLTVVKLLSLLLVVIVMVLVVVVVVVILLLIFQVRKALKKKSVSEIKNNQWEVILIFHFEFTYF